MIRTGRGRLLFERIGTYFSRSGLVRERKISESEGERIVLCGGSDGVEKYEEREEHEETTGDGYSGHEWVCWKFEWVGWVYI
ncbi:hypothetical protein Hanom_Chr14g01287841 [Helianthus anomalus]